MDQLPFEDELADLIRKHHKAGVSAGDMINDMDNVITDLDMETFDFEPGA